MRDKHAILKKHELKFSTILIILLCISAVLAIIWYVLGPMKNPYLVIIPRTIKSLAAIIPANFFHSSAKHLLYNLIGLWISGTLAMLLEGTRALKGLLAGIIFCGVAQFIFGAGGSIHLGFSGGIFALLAVALIGSIRSSNIFLILLTCTVLYLSFGDSILQTLMPTEYAAEQHISWLGHLGGFIGGIWYQTRSRTIALQILLKDDLINVQEYELIAGRMTLKQKGAALLGKAKNASVIKEDEPDMAYVDRAGNQNHGAGANNQARDASSSEASLPEWIDAP